MQVPRPIIPGRASMRRRRRRAGRTAFILIVLVLLVAGAVVYHPWSRGGKNTTSPTTPSDTGSFSGKNPIKHIVFLVKENRTFDTFFGKYPGAEGATSGKGLSATHQQITIPLAPAYDENPHDITH